LDVIAGSVTSRRTSSAVYRDPSAWYHIVCTYDTTNATGSNRIRLYVNGTQVTSFSSSTDPSQNYASGLVNSTNSHEIGRLLTEYYDGYLTEVNFIDGQALTPSSFGETDLITGVWKPKRYAGTYGTNGFYLPFKYESATAYAGGFNGSNQYLSLAQNSAFNFGTGDFTVETWVYANSWSSAVSPIISLGDGAVGGGSPIYSGWALRYSTGAGLGWYRFDGTETHLTNNIFLATNQWIHLAVSRSGGVLKIFVNGAQVYSASNTVTYNNVNSNTLKIGGNWTVGGPTVTWFNGYISNVRIVNNTGLYTANFAPPTTNLTAVSGTALLTLQGSSIVDNSTNAFAITNNNSVTTSLQNIFGAPILTADQSGNSNNWQSYNLSLASGVTYDSMTDVPTLTSATASNFCTLNPLACRYTGTQYLFDGNLRWYFASTSTWISSGATIGASSGKYYWECSMSGVGGSQAVIIGIAPNSVISNYITNNLFVGQSAGDYSYYTNGNKFNNGINTLYGATYGDGDIIGVALDMDAGTLTFYKNNVSQGTAFSGLSGTFFPAVGSTGAQVYCNFGQRPFAYTPPTGYVALNTFNLPDSTIKKGKAHMDVLLVTGTGSNQSYTGLDFEPGLSSVKSRSASGRFDWFDSNRGVILRLDSSTTEAEAADNDLYAFDSNGFSGSLDNGTTYASWHWKTSTSTVTNTSGTISSSVRVNPSAGCSVVTYTGNGSANQTVGHGLGVSPAFVIVKARNAAINWPVHHQSYLNQSSDFLLLSASDAGATASNWFSKTSSTIGFPTSYASTNGNGTTYVAYCWAEIAGFSKFNFYTGNGSSDGPFIYTGFRPKFVLVKRSDAGPSNWTIEDTSRDAYNVAQTVLYPHLSNAEGTQSAIDILSNGFKVRHSTSEQNGSGATYMYACWAEVPFKQSLAR
jgi:hypothetical protein